MIATICPNCGAPIGTDYIQLGAPVICASCRHRVVPKIPAGTRIQLTDYGITFNDFKKLLSQESYRSSILPLLKRWFAYEVHLTGAGRKGTSLAELIEARDDASPRFTIQTADGQPVDPLDLHLRIQGDREKRLDLYNAAMRLWR